MQAGVRAAPAAPVGADARAAGDAGSVAENAEAESWRKRDVRWQMSNVRWQMSNGKWQMSDGRCRLSSSRKLGRDADLVAQESTNDETGISSAEGMNTADRPGQRAGDEQNPPSSGAVPEKRKTKRPGSYQGHTLWWLGSAADGHHAQRRYTIHVTRNEPELNQAQNSPNPDRFF